MPKVTNICANAAEEIEQLPDNTVLISINEEEREGDLYPLKLDRKDYRILTLRFSDVTSRKYKHDGSFWTPISDEQALQILDFINMHVGKDVIVHCLLYITYVYRFIQIK